MKLIATLVVLLALVGSAMAWDITDTMQYTNVKTGFQEAGSTLVLPQIIGTTSGAYIKEPHDAYGAVWGQVDNTLTGVTVNRINTNPNEDATGADFSTTLTQGGSATMATHAMNSGVGTGVDATTPEISGTASAYQNEQVGGQFSQASANFDSRAIIGMSNIASSSTNGVETPDHFAVTQIIPGDVASVDAKTHGAGLFNTANLGETVTSAISQNWVGTGWDEPTYSGGIDMWANFAGACDPHCSNPIVSTVSGKAATSIFPANIEDLAETEAPGAGNIGDSYYWGSDFGKNPQIQGATIPPA